MSKSGTPAGFRDSSNDVILIVAQIQELFVHDELLQEDGLINLSKGKVVAINGLDTYTLPKFKTQLSYQRPKNIN